MWKDWDGVSHRNEFREVCGKVDTFVINLTEAQGKARVKEWKSRTRWLVWVCECQRNPLHYIITGQVVDGNTWDHKEEDILTDEQIKEWRGDAGGCNLVWEGEVTGDTGPKWWVLDAKARRGFIVGQSGHHLVHSSLLVFWRGIVLMRRAIRKVRSVAGSWGKRRQAECIIRWWV